MDLLVRRLGGRPYYECKGRLRWIRFAFAACGIYAYHGVNPEEKEKGQPFELDVTLGVDLHKSGSTDDLNDTVNYSKVSKRIVAVMLAQKDDLIERAASRVAETIVKEFPVEEVTVCLKKPRAPIAADFDYVAVSITRRREDYP